MARPARLPRLRPRVQPGARRKAPRGASVQVTPRLRVETVRAAKLRAKQASMSEGYFLRHCVEHALRALREADDPALRARERRDADGGPVSAPALAETLQVAFSLAPETLATVRRRAAKANMTQGYFLRCLIERGLKALPPEEDATILARIEITDAVAYVEALNEEVRAS